LASSRSNPIPPQSHRADKAQQEQLELYDQILENTLELLKVLIKKDKQTHGVLKACGLYGHL
jgi:hypothetical protein